MVIPLSLALIPLDLDAGKGETRGGVGVSSRDHNVEGEDGGGVQKSCRVIALTEPQTPDPARQWGGRAGRALWVPENPGGPGPGLWPHTGPKQPPADTATAADRGQALGDPSATGWASRTGLRRNVPAGSKRQARARGQPLGPY